MTFDRWKRGVPVEGKTIFTKTVRLMAVAVIASIILSAIRGVGGLADPITGLNDAYSWGVWKTFNVMTLTALGSGALGIGAAVWLFHRENLHQVMRVALLTSFLFYTAGLLALFVDVGRPWNFWNMMLPWRWNTHSALWEVALCMPTYCFLFLAFENLPPVLERIAEKSGPEMRRRIEGLMPLMKKIYPYMVGGAFILPAMHQSSLGALMLLAGTQLHPLWQTQMLPLLYLVQAGICGIACVIFVLIVSCLTWKRPLDKAVLGELGNLLSWTILVWVAMRLIDVVVRGEVGKAFEPNLFALIFWIENLSVTIPAIVLRRPEMREDMQWLFRMVIPAGLGGLLYRFVPTTIAYTPNGNWMYFPSFMEFAISFGYITLAVMVYNIAVKVLPILPAPLSPKMFRARA
jgi:Ni/Fe-hydrogenase subunit HybB-like protein